MRRGGAVYGDVGEAGRLAAIVNLRIGVTSDSCTQATTNGARALNMAEKTFTRKQISEWDSKKETVFIIDNVVYNVTKFLDEHPGGHEVLMHVAGKDASEDFDDVGHSIDAKTLMKKYVIGEIVAEERIEVQKKPFDWDVSKTEMEGGFLTSWKFPVLLGVVVTLLYSYFFG